MVILDDDCDVHFPDHFRWCANNKTIFIGYGGSKYIKRHWRSKNFILRRIFKYIYTLVLLVKSFRRPKILVYDDILFYILLRCLTVGHISLRITHLKDYEAMPKWYQNFIYSILGRFSKNNEVFVISKLAQRYLRCHYSIRTKVLTSMVDRTAFHGEKDFNGILVYSGTVSGRNIIDAIVHISKFASKYLNVSKLIVMAPKMTQLDKQQICSGLSCILTVEVIEGARDREIKSVYKRADYGIAFYDVYYNSILKQNFPLKTLEYLASDIIPIANKIPAHRELIDTGFCFVELDNNLNFLPLDSEFMTSEIKISNRRLVNRLDCYFTISNLR